MSMEILHKENSSNSNGDEVEGKGNIEYVANREVRSFKIVPCVLRLEERE